MKLRLPHKFQTALMAALASVSITTLSTGTAAYAATSSLEDAELQLVDFTTQTMTDAATAGWTFSDGFAGNDTGVYTSTGTVTRIDSDHDWTSVIKDGNFNRTLWAGIITINVNNLPGVSGMIIQSGTGTNGGSASAAGDRVEGLGYGTESGAKHVYGAWQNNAVWGNNKCEINASLANYADANGNVTLGIFYYGTGTRIFLANMNDDDGGLKSAHDHKNLSIFLSTSAGVQYTNLFLFGAESSSEISNTDMASMMKEAGAYHWTGSTDGNWNAATTNWTHYGSDLAVAIGTNGGNANTNVVFGKEATNKNVTLAGATTVGALTVSGGDYTFNQNGNLTTSGITIAEGASLARTGSGSITGTLSGAGKFILPNGSTTLGVTLGSDWTGTVQLTGVTLAGQNLNTYGIAGSTVEINGTTGYIVMSNTTFNPMIKLSGNGLTITQGSSSKQYTFQGGMSGTGDFNVKFNNQTYIFTGDVSQWTGAMNVSVNNTNVKFYGSANTVNAAFTRTAGALNMEVGDGTNSFTTTFNKAVTATKLAVNNKASATLKETLTLTNDLTLDGSATLEKGGSVGTIDLSHSGAAHGTLTLAAGQNLTYSSFWGANNNKLLLGEGATVKQANNAPIEIEGLAGESYVSSSANAQFGLTASAYTLHNVKATINTASDNVQLHFDNSKLVTSQDITLKNLQSVFSGMEIGGGTTTVGASGATGTVTLGAVTLSGGTLALADLVTGNASSIDVTGTSAISGGTLTLGGTITTEANTTLTLGGTVLFADGGITTSGAGSLAFGESVKFDIHQLTEGENHTYTLFNGAVDLTSLNATAADHITGVITTGRKWTFDTNGHVSYEILSQDLVWAGGAGTWTTADSEKPWLLKGETDPVQFNDGDEVTFTSDGGAAVATLGSNITAATMTVEASADATVNNATENPYTLSVDVLNISGSLTTNTAMTAKYVTVSGSLTTNAEMTVNAVTIEAGGVWNMGGHLDLTAITYSNAGTLNVMSGAAVTISKATDTSAVTGEGTLNLSVGTEVIQGYAPTFKAGTPFTGTLVYNEGDIGNHDSYVTLDNTFRGTLELHGRMNGHSMNLGGATTLRLVGDRSSNVTGIWDGGNNMTIAQPLEVIGGNQVEIYANATTTISGTVNSGTNKVGRLTKVRNGTMTFNGAVALAEFTTPGGTVNFNSSASLDRINIDGGTVNLGGGATADYSLGQAWLSGGSIAIGANGVKSLTAEDLVVRSTNTLNSAAAEPTVFNVTRFDVSNFNTNFTLQNVTLNVSGEATAAVLNTAQNEDQATVTVGDKATLNLNGSVVWNKQDTEHSKLDYVNLTINNGGTANVNAGAGNILNNATVNAGGKLNFDSDTSTTVLGTLTVGGIVDNSGTVTFSTGTVATGNVGTLTGTGTYNLSGTLATEGTGTLKIADAIIHGAEGAAITGNVEIAGGTFASPLTLGGEGSVITVTKVFNVDTTSGADLTFAGTMVLDALESSGATYSGGQQSEDNGFLTGAGTVKVFNVLDEGGITQSFVQAATVTYRGVGGRLGENGEFTAEGSGGDDTIFHVRTVTDTAETYSYAQGEHPATFNAVSLDAEGVAFNIDSPAAALAKVTVLEAASGTVTIGDSATIGSVETGNGLTFDGSGTLTLGTDGSATAAISGTGALTFNGPAVTLYGDNSTFTGDLTISGGTVTVGDDLALGSMVAGTRTVKLAGGTLDVNGHEGTGTGYTVEFAGGKLTNTGLSRGNGSRQLVAFATITANSEISNATGHEMGFGTAGFAPITVTFANDAMLNKTGTGTFWVSNATVSGDGGFKVSEGTVNFQQGGTYAATDLEMAGGTVAGTLNLAGNITIDTTKDSTLSAAITGTNRTITMEGTGTLTLSGGSSFTGSVLVNEGTVKLGNGNALGAENNTVTIEQGATVDMNGKDNRMYSYTLHGGSLVNNGADTVFNHTQNNSITLTDDSTVGGSGKLWMIAGGWADTTANLNDHILTKEGTGTFSFVNTNISAGTIAVKGGTVEFYDRGGDGSNNSNVQANIELNGGTITGAYNYTDSVDAVIRTLTAKQDVTASAAITIGSNVTLATNVDNGKTLTMSGAISGDGGLTKTGDGTLALTAAASYNGATAVDQGILALGSSITTTGDVTVAAGAGITFGNGATISANSMTLTNGAKLDFSDYQGAIGSEIHVVTTTNGVNGYEGAIITGPTAPRGMQARVDQKDNDIVLTFQAKSDATMHLYILTGQSNSLGAVKDSPLNATMLAAYQSEGLLFNGNMNKDSGVRFETDPTWQIVAPQKPDGSGYNNNPCMGPEYGFSYIMENKDWGAQLLGEDGTLAVVKGSLDGGGNGYWLQDANAYQSLLGSVKESIQDAVALGYSNISLDGLMYLQGESNNANEASQAATRFTNFIGYLKSDLQSWLTENPELTGITLSFDSNTVTGEPRLGSDARQTTEGQFLELATSNDMLNADKNGKGHVLTNDLAVTNCDGLNVHYTGNAQLTIGARYAYAFAVQNDIDVGAVRGQDRSKTLNEAGAWWMEKLPGENEVATWDISSVSTVNDIADGQTLTVGGIKIDEVYSATATAQGQGSIAINGGAISLGAGGINLVGGDLAITSAVSARATQTWQAAEGHKLAVNGTTTIGDGATLTLEDGLYLTFGAITGTGNLEIGHVTFDMDLDYMMANGLGKYRTSTEDVAENGFFTGKLDLVKLTGETSAITFTGDGSVEKNITKAGDLVNYNLQLSDDSKALQLMGLDSDEDTYFTRKGEVTYTSDDTAEYGIYTAKQVMLSGSVDQPATLKLASALKEGVTIVASGLGGTVDIVDGVTLAAASVNAAGGPVVLAGKGTFALGGTVALPTNVSMGDQDKWTGTVRIANVSGTAAYNIKLNDLGNASSIVEFEGVTGYLNTDSTTYTPNIKLTGEGLNIDAGATDGTYYFNGDVTGSGKLNLSLSRGSNNHTYVFAGDVAGWEGQLLAPSNKTLTVKFSDKADTVNASITRTGGTLNLYALTDTTFNGAITGLTSFVVEDTVDATIAGGAGATNTLGAITMKGTSTLTLQSAASGGAMTKSGAGTATISGQIVSLTSITASEGKVVVNGIDAEHSAVGTVKATAAGAGIVLTNVAADFTNGYKGDLEVGAGARVTVKDNNDGWDYGTKHALTVKDGGYLDLGAHRWSINAGTTITLAGGTIAGTGEGSYGALDFFDNNTMYVTEDSTVAAKVRLRAGQTTFQVADSKNLALTGAFSDKNGELIKTGTGTMTMSGANSHYSGNITLSAGTIKVTGASALGTGTVTLNNGTTLAIGGSEAATAGNVKLADNCAATITLGNDLAMSQLDTIGANHTLSIGSAEGVTKTLTTGKLGFDNVGTVISLQNAHMVVTGAATAGVLEAHSNNRGTMTVGENATLDLQGTTQWNTNDSKYVDLVVKDGGSVSVSGGTENKIRNVNMGENGTNASLSFGAETHTAIANTNVAASAHASVSGAGNAVDFGNVNVGENAELSVMNLGSAASVSVSDVTIGAGATMGAYTGSDVSSLDEAALVIASGKTLTADAGATLNANLEMASGSHLDVSGAQSTMGLLMGSNVTLNSNSYLDITKDPVTGESIMVDDVNGFLRNYLASGEHDLYYLYIGKDGDPIELTINGVPQQADLDKRSWNDYDMDANTIYANLQAQTFYVRYDGSNVGMVAIGLIPEPTTSTLSLLALCALAARRRRK
ncbi:MAG: autotransporter-associated beta strand repeat-containing protein [Akkermansia sp.]|nr:autotransporter-associated beta strand repeat-containing protein [Akkermansia sp.]